MLKDKKVLVTGATGFIGGRLIEKLILEHKADVRALIRNYSRAARIARFDITMINTSLNDSLGIEEAVKGCNVVFHCAYDAISPQSNIDAIRNLAEACIKHQARLVHMSTISVYEPLKDGDLDETKQLVPSGILYADNKLEVEEEVFRYINNKGLQAVVLQPTIVYGPFGKPWTHGPIKQLLSGTVVLPDGGNGLCNQVYVDDVCEAMILAAERNNVLGERFLISDSEPVTWREFFGAYEEALGIKSVSFLPSEEIKKKIGNPIYNLKLIIADPKRIVLWGPARKFALFMRSRLTARMKIKLKKIFKTYRKLAPKPIYMPNSYYLVLYGSKCRVRIDKARRMLNYNPKFIFKRAMALTTEYIRWALPEQILPGN